MKHISLADVERVRAGSISADEAGDVGRHVASCAQCTALVEEMLSIEESVAALNAELNVGEQPSRRYVWIGAAAAIVALAIALAAFISGSRKPSPAVVRTQPPPVRVTTQMRPEWMELVAQVRATKRLPFPADLAELAAEDSLRGETSSHTNARVWPAATAVDDVRPQFTWTAPAGARSSVTLRRATGNSVVARSPRLTTTRWQPDEPLERGTSYVWQVEVVNRGEAVFLPAPPAPPAIFRVISEREHEELASAQRAFPDDHLLLGLLHARAGIADAARRELESSRDPLARELIRQLPDAR